MRLPIPGMRRLAPSAAVAALLLTGCGAPSPPPERGVEPTAAGGERLGDLIPELMATAGIPGLSIARIEDGEVAWAGSFGVANAESGEPVTERTVFEAASLSKPVFAYAVLRLVERGELGLDRPLHELLEYERFAGAERARALTPRLVLSHQTGLPNWGGEALEFGFEPGSGFGYSGEGYLYLQRVIEATTGLTLDQLVEREVFTPLGMPDSRFSWSEGESFPLATGHDGGGTPRKRNPPEANAAGSLHTTATDYARFLIALLEARGLDRTTLDGALAPAVWMRGDERGSDRVDEIAGRVGWGLGWGVQEVTGERIVWHWGDNEIFHAFVALHPEDRSGVVYLANSSNGLAIARRLVEKVVGDMDPTFAWLGYDQSDEPGWTERRAGLLAEGAGDYAAAIAHFERALTADPGHPATVRRIEWLRDLVRIADEPVVVPAGRLERYAGAYGPRSLTFDGSNLVYQRQGRDPYRLRPVSQDTFALEGLTDFRIQVVLDEGGTPVKLVGHYLDGDSDQSPRDPD